MTTNFDVYVSKGSIDKLKAYIKCKKAGTVIIFKLTDTSKIYLVQITREHTLESARTISFYSNEDNLKRTIRMVNYDKYRRSYN